VLIRVDAWLPLAERFRTAFGCTPVDIVRGWQPRLHQALLVRVTE